MTMFHEQAIFRFLWMNSDLSKAHCTYIMEHYPKIRQLDICIREFRNIYDRKKYGAALFIH